MSMVDADKQEGDRANPRLNTDDNVSNRMAHKTIGTTYKTAGNPDTNRLIFDKGSVKGFDDSENNNIFIGYDPALSTRPIVRIAKDGFDQETATGDQLIFNSDQNVFKILTSNTISVPVVLGTHGASSSGIDTSTLVTATFPNPSGVVPGALVFLNNAGNYAPIADGSTYSSAFTATSWANYVWQITLGDTAISFAMKNYWATGVGGSIGAINVTFAITYYLLQETAAAV